MVRDAEANAEADKARRQLVEARNHAEAAYHQTEKALKEFGDKVAPEDRKAIEEALAALKATLAKDGVTRDEIVASEQALLQASMKLGEAMYKANAGAPAEGGEEPKSGDDNVVDAQFEEVDGDKKN